MARKKKRVKKRAGLKFLFILLIVLVPLAFVWGVFLDFRIPFVQETIIGEDCWETLFVDEMGSKLSCVSDNNCISDEYDITRCSKGFCEYKIDCEFLEEGLLVGGAEL